jgi:serine/threonine-protein kinase
MPRIAEVDDTPVTRTPAEPGRRKAGDPEHDANQVGQRHAPSLIEGSSPRLTSITDPLRRARVRAAALFLFVALGALLAWRAITVGGELLLLQAAVVCALGAALAVLSSNARLSAKAVRFLELGVFGLTALYLSARQYQLMTVWATTGEAALIGAVKTTMIGTILLAFSYGMLIPNTWRQAARVVAVIVGLPVLTEVLLLATHQRALTLALEFATFPRVTEDVIQMTLAAALTIYGTHVINTLRSEAFVARQLNQYRLGQRIGEGGMGEVYLAEHRLLKRPCALKLIRPDSASDPDALGRFEREVRATARLSHPNTVEIYDYGQTGEGIFFYVMELLRGLSLEELVTRHGPMPPGRAIYLVRQVCGALAEAHAAGLIHRDVKPANILACTSGARHDVAKLLDFGLVKWLEPDASLGPVADSSPRRRIRGTPLYMAPEQIIGSTSLDHRCDLYSLGGVAYTLLAGRPPFLGNDSGQVMIAHVRDPVPPLRLLRPEIPEDLEQVVLRCLAKSPDARYQTGEELADALGACGSAAEWTAASATAWWHEHHPNGFDRLDHASDPVGTPKSG